MPTSGSDGEARLDDVLLVDTSVAVPLVVDVHESHRAVSEALAERRLGLSGHAAFETFSVLTRLSPPLRRRPEEVRRVLSVGFPATRFLDPEESAELLDRLPGLRAAGGRVYDALVGATAVAHGLPLATRDIRALDTYRALGVELEVIS